MAELSANWRKLQAQLKTGKQPQRLSVKRKADDTPLKSKKSFKVQYASSDRGSQPAVRSTSSSEMGGVHSSRAKVERGSIQSPCLEIWAQGNDISSETLAEAYNLGTKKDFMIATSAEDKVNHGKTLDIDIGKYVALDCEMVGIGPGGHESALARVSLVDFHGRQIYDSYVKPRERVTNWRTAVSGVSQREMRFARDFEDVQRELFDILKGRILIGHDIKHDLDALELDHPLRDIRDTAKHPEFRKYGNGRKPALRILVQELLGTDIQDGAHSSTEDARATMLLFRKHKPSFDVDHANRYSHTPNTGSKKKPKKHIKRR